MALALCYLISELNASQGCDSDLKWAESTDIARVQCTVRFGLNLKSPKFCRKIDAQKSKIQEEARAARCVYGHPTLLASGISDDTLKLLNT
jgi:hypothetical protein